MATLQLNLIGQVIELLAVRLDHEKLQYRNITQLFT